MINHKGINDGDFWAPPGGGLQFGETIENCLIREFMEEAHLDIKIDSFQFICEFINLPLHAIELFFKVEKTGGVLKKGQDPEIVGDQIIQEVKFMSWDEIDELTTVSRHGIFNFVSKSPKILDLKGYFKL